MSIDMFYKDWCKKNKKNGGVLIGSSIKQLLNDFQAHCQRELIWEMIEDWQDSRSDNEELKFSYADIESDLYDWLKKYEL